MLDAMGPVSVSAEGSTGRLQRSLIKNRRGPRPARRFESIDEMVKARRMVSDLSEAAARLICERSARQTDSHFEWRSDPALNWVSSLVMTDEQAMDLVRNIQAPALTFTVTEDSPWSSRAKLEERRRAIAHGKHETLEGHHHFHMDDPGQIADTVRDFIIDNDRSPSKRPS